MIEFYLDLLVRAGHAFVDLFDSWHGWVAALAAIAALFSGRIQKRLRSRLEFEGLPRRVGIAIVASMLMWALLDANYERFQQSEAARTRAVRELEDAKKAADKLASERRPRLNVSAARLETGEYIARDFRSETSGTLKFRVRVRNSTDFPAYGVHTEPLEVPGMRVSAPSLGEVDLGPRESELYRYEIDFSCPTKCEFDDGKRVAQYWVRFYYKGKPEDTTFFSTGIKLDLWRAKAVVLERDIE